MDDFISRQAAIDALGERPLVWNEWADEYTLGQRNQYDTDKLAIETVPSAQQELTDDRAIEHLQSTGWMQNHDKQMYEMGLKEQLADDSGSYDALLPSAQPTQTNTSNALKSLDCVSRRAVDKIINYLLENDNLQASPSVWHGLHMIKQLPTVDAVPWMWLEVFAKTKPFDSVEAFIAEAKEMSRKMYSCCCSDGGRKDNG